MDIEVGEYIRTDNGYIAKVIENRDELILDKEIAYHGKYRSYLDEEEKEYVKHSKNIIDLIEVGDYVNGYKVSDKESTLLSTNVKGIDKSGYHIPISQYGENIKTILTHEQYESNCYRLED